MLRGTPLLAAAAALLLAAIATAGCGTSGMVDRPGESATLVLDSRAGAVHAGIALAVQRDFVGAEGVDLRVRAPAAATGPVRLLLSGRATFAVLDIHDLARARARAHDIVGVMPLVQRPLPSLLTGPGRRRLRRLARRAPPYPELVLCVTRRTLDEDRSIVRATVRALRRGYEEALADPESAISALGDLGATHRAALQRQFDAIAPALTVGVPRFGDFDEPALRRWAAWEAGHGLVPTPPDVARAFDAGFGG